MELPCIYLAGHESIPSPHFTSNPGISGCRDGGENLFTYLFIHFEKRYGLGWPYSLA